MIQGPTLIGGEELDRILDRVGLLGRAKVIRAIEESARTIQREARRAVQVRSGRTRRSIRTRYDKDRLGAEVAPTWFVARFLEYGTVKQPARPFLGPSAEAERPKLLARLREALGDAVDEALR